MESHNQSSLIKDDLVIKVNNVSKIYKLYSSPKARLKEALHPFRKKYHKNFHALKNIKFELKKGEILGILGKNGSGKSTLLKIITGILQPTSGSVFKQGKIAALLELGSGLNPQFTGIQNIYFYGSIMEYSKKEMDNMVDDIISFADIGDFIYQPLKLYSTGMKSRLAFAINTVINPDILILDEVLSVGDALYRRKAFARMESLMSRGTTVLFVSHSEQSIIQICNKAILLDKGELILEGSPKIVATYYQKMLFAKKKNILKVRKEILKLNKNQKIKNELQSNIYVDNEEKNKNNDVKKIDDFLGQKDLKKNENNIILKPNFIPDLIPKSTVMYKDYQVDFRNIKITTLDGEKVNCLITGERYIFHYTAHFGINVKNVQFGMSIRNEKGIVLAGYSFPLDHNKYVEKISKGNQYHLKWFFFNYFLFGYYYINCGITMTKDHKKIFLNRIVDSLVFKVQKNRQTASSIVSLNQTVTIEKLNNHSM
jgi:lipopolysaccharide transport system ATP-binding protein